MGDGTEEQDGAKTVTLKTVLVGAAGTILGGVLAAILAGVFGLVNSHSASTSAHRQAQDDFLRTQRQAAYSQYLSDIDALEIAQLRFDQSLLDRFSLPTATKRENESEDLYAKLSRENKAIQLIASKPSVDRGVELFEVLRQIQFKLRYVYGQDKLVLDAKRHNQNLKLPSFEKVFKEVETAFGQIDPAVSRFVDAGRSDLTDGAD